MKGELYLKKKNVRRVLDLDIRREAPYRPLLCLETSIIPLKKSDVYNQFL